jgi:hypothetical protein
VIAVCVDGNTKLKTKSRHERCKYATATTIIATNRTTSNPEGKTSVATSH